MSWGQVRTQGPGDSHPSSPIPLPSALNSRFQRSDTSPSLNSLKNRVQRRRRFLCPHAWYPCPSPAKHHAPRSLRFPANLQAPRGDLSPVTHPTPDSSFRSPRARGAHLPRGLLWRGAVVAPRVVASGRRGVPGSRISGADRRATFTWAA